MYSSIRRIEATTYPKPAQLLKITNKSNKGDGQLLMRTGGDQPMLKIGIINLAFYTQQK